MSDKWSSSEWMGLPMDVGRASSSGQTSHEDVKSEPSAIKTTPNHLVSRLFTMLEEPAYKHIVQWTDTRDGFVVLDPYEFTKTIIPRHFKHSNFASFVRQLNKYDFHKVRPPQKKPNDPSTNWAYPENAWVFKHPDFQPHNRDQLERIKRKVPASTRKTSVPPAAVRTSAPIAMAATTPAEYSMSVPAPSHMPPNGDRALSDPMARAVDPADVDNIRRSNEVLTARMDQLEQENRVLLNNFYTLFDVFNRQSSYVQKALELLSEQPNADSSRFGSLSDSLAKDLAMVCEQMTSRRRQDVPQHQQQQQQQQHQQELHHLQHQQQHQQHQHHQQHQPQPQQLDEMGRRSSSASLAIRRSVPSSSRYSVLLAEEDETSAKICRRLLGQFGCEVEIANNGIDTVQRAEASAYDFIIINTILPRLDGISATELIRNFDNSTPIIVLSVKDEPSGIRSDRPETFRNKGVDVVLAKPFTKSELFKTLSLVIDQASPRPRAVSQLGPHDLYMDAKDSLED